MLALAYLEIVLILKQDGCTVCAERSIGSEIILGTPMDLLDDISHVESHFNAFGDIVVSVQDRYIVLDAPDGTHR
jgi:hypothetical protein